MCPPHLARVEGGRLYRIEALNQFVASLLKWLVGRLEFKLLRFHGGEQQPNIGFRPERLRNEEFNS